VNALGSSDEDLRTIAGIFLVRAGDRSVRLLREALESGRNLPMLLRIIGDAGAHEFEADLRSFLDHTDQQLVQAACDALKLLALKSK